MNLIEQLGGYKNSKGIREAYARNGWSVSDVCKGFHECFTLKDLDCALLEYRRQHNIFEVGDKVVHIYDCENSMLFTVKDISDKGYSFGNDWGWRGVVSDMGVGHTFRHATDEEIAAGRRL